ncbi:MAG: tetratricopeptide repeat protein, partial [Phycisphaerales bacterium]
ELRTSGFAPAPLAVADLRLTITGALRESQQRQQLVASAAQTIAQTARDAQTDPLAAETLVRMLRAADELGVIAHHDYIPPATRETITDAINAQFRALGPESKYIASLVEVAMTGVYGPALSRLTTETDRIAQDAAAAEGAKLEYQRILTRFTLELARTYQALEAEAEQRARAFAENNPRNANAQLLYIDAILRRGEVQPALTEPLTSALDRLRDILGHDSYTYNLAESRRLYATPATRTPEIARQEIISRLDRFVEGSQEAGASVEALHLASKWWELLPGSLDRRVRYLLRAQRTSPGAWGIYPDLTRALIEDEQWDIAAAAISQWSRQLSPATGLRSQRRDLAQAVGSRWTQIASSAQSAETFETSRHIWAIAIRDAFEIAASTQDPADRLRAAQVLAAAPDDAVARARAVEILGFDDQMTRRVDASRPSQRRPGMAVADLTRAAAFRLAEDLLADIPSSGGPTSEQIPAIAGAGQLISENAVASRLTLGASSGQPDGSGPAAEADRPDPDAALEAMARALSGAPRATADRAIGLFYAASYNPETWTPFADQTRSALLTAAATDGLTELEQRALVFPLSQLGEIDAAIRIQRAVAESTDEADRLTDVIAIAEILRDSGQTQAAYEAVLALPESQRARLTTNTVPINPQALVALLELETEQTEQPVTTAFVRRILDRPADSIPALQLTINAADGPRPRQELLLRVSDELTNMSSAGGGEFRPAVANLWYMTAAQTPENHPLRRTLLNEAIARLALVADLEDPGAQVFALQRKAYCEIELGNIDAGIRSYRQAIQLDDSNRPDPATLNNLADALLRRGDPVEATQFASRAIEATRALTIPNSVLSVFYDTLGKSHLGSGNTDAAISALKTALELDDTNAPARISLAEALIEAGRPVDEAKAIINAIGPAAEQALSEKNRARLAKLRID